MSFRIGQEVVCVVDFHKMATPPTYGLTHPHRPDQGKHYTIRELFWDSTAQREGCRLAEIRNPICAFKDETCEGGFPTFCFRPVVVRKTDISVFQKMLEPNHLEHA